MHTLVRAHKAWIRARLREIAAQAGNRKPDTTAQQLLALLDGSSVEAFVQGSIEPIRASKLPQSFSRREPQRDIPFRGVSHLSDADAFRAGAWTAPSA